MLLPLMFSAGFALQAPQLISAAASADDPRAAIVFAIGESLGAGPNKPDYWTDLQTARHQNDVALFCNPLHALQGLPADLSDKIVADIIRQLRAQGFANFLQDRPAHVTDLIVTAISSFEVGRMVSISTTDRQALCATTNAPQH